MRTLVFACTLFAATHSTEARLLETRAEMVQRYGRPIVTTLSSDTFTNAELRIEVTYGPKEYEVDGHPVEGKIVREIVMLKGVGDMLTEKAIDDILNANSGGSQWPERSSTGNKARQRIERIARATSGITTKDGKRRAVIRASAVELSILNITKPKKDATGY